MLRTLISEDVTIIIGHWYGPPLISDLHFVDNYINTRNITIVSIFVFTTIFMVYQQIIAEHLSL